MAGGGGAVCAIMVCAGVMEAGVAAAGRAGGATLGTSGWGGLGASAKVEASGAAPPGGPAVSDGNSPPAQAESSPRAATATQVRSGNMPKSGLSLAFPSGNPAGHRGDGAVKRSLRSLPRSRSPRSLLKRSTGDKREFRELPGFSVVYPMLAILGGIE